MTKETTGQTIEQLKRGSREWMQEIVTMSLHGRTIKEIASALNVGENIITYDRAQLRNNGVIVNKGSTAAAHWHLGDVKLVDWWYSRDKTRDHILNRRQKETKLSRIKISSIYVVGEKEFVLIDKELIPIKKD